jgi:hypothetical protein
LISNKITKYLPNEDKLDFEDSRTFEINSIAQRKLGGRVQGVYFNDVINYTSIRNKAKNSPESYNISLRLILIFSRIKGPRYLLK